MTARQQDKKFDPNAVSEHDYVMVPAKDKTYVPFGDFKDVEVIELLRGQGWRHRRAWLSRLPLPLRQVEQRGKGLTKGESERATVEGPLARRLDARDIEIAGGEDDRVGERRACLGRVLSEYAPQVSLDLVRVDRRLAKRRLDGVALAAAAGEPAALLAGDHPSLKLERDASAGVE
jgi:hypothetical protein